MSIAHHMVATRWADQINEGPEARSMHGTNVGASGDIIKSYHWWEMGRIVRDERERPIFFLLNGDRYSPSTSRHQGDVRGAAGLAARTYEEKSGRQFPVLIVPYSALDAAGVNKNTITPLEVRPDRYVPYERSASELPDYATPVNPVSETGLAGRIHTHNGEYAEIVLRGGKYRWTDQVHRLGDSLFSAVITERRAPDAMVTKRVKFLSSFDYQERSAPYFLCELPRTAATTVEEAYAALVPEPVRLAQKSGVEVIRQGDIFAIPTSLTTRELSSMAKEFEEVIQSEAPTVTREVVTRRKRAVLLGTNHTASEVVITKDDSTYARGTLRHEPGGWRGPDHARRKMNDGRTWHRIIKNTVPLDKSHYRGGSTTANQSGQSRAWTLGGAVD